MKVRYILNSAIVSDDEGQDFSVYGITVLDERNNTLRVIKDIFFDELIAKQFVELCNAEKLEFVHLQGAVEDALI